MLTLTPRMVRRTLLPASYVAFLIGLLASAWTFFRDRPFDGKQIIVSDLLSPDDNPHGYAVLAGGIIISALLLGPAAAIFHRSLENKRPYFVLAGTLGLAVGIASAIAIGILAPITHDYTPLHIQLASATFVGVLAGTWCHLLAARAAGSLIRFQFAALLAVVFLCYGPVEFNNQRLLTSLAFWEWVVYADCGAALWAVARAVEFAGSDTEPGRRL